MIETGIEFWFLMLIGQTIDAPGANANNRNGFASYRSEAAQLMRAEVESSASSHVSVGSNGRRLRQKTSLLL
jgi:hypothetical protein